MNKIYIIKYTKGELLVGNASPINYPHYETYTTSDLAKSRLDELHKENDVSDIRYICTIVDSKHPTYGEF